MPPPVPLPLGGAARDRHGRWRRDAMDARGFSARCARRRKLLSRTAKSRRPGPPTLGSSLHVTNARATEANKPGTPGRTRISRKAIAQGMPACVRLYLWISRVHSMRNFSHTRLRVQRHPAFPVPSEFREGRYFVRPRAFHAARTLSHVLASSLRAKRSNPEMHREAVWIASLRSQ